MAVAFALLWYGYRHYVEVQDFSTRFDALISQFVEEDEFLSQVDVLMEDLDDASLSPERSEATARIPEVVSDVQRIKDNARSAMPLAVGERDEAVLGQISETADARIEMLQAAQAAFAKASEREGRVKEASEIWNAVVAEDQQAKEAASEANGESSESQVASARDKTADALEKLKAASLFYGDISAR